MTTMTANDFTLSFIVQQTPQQVYEAINDVQAWWSKDFTGSSHQQGDEFEVRFFGDVHYSKHKVEAMLPGEKVVWTVTDSCLNFLQNKSEWTGTQMLFEIKKQGVQTKLVFTHVGLTPEIECYTACSSGWTKFLLHSLKNFIETGEGNLDVLNSEIEEKNELIKTLN